VEEEHQEQHKKGSEAQNFQPAEKWQPVLPGLENVQPGKKFGEYLFGGRLN